MEEKYYYHKFNLGKRKVVLCATSKSYTALKIFATASWVWDEEGTQGGTSEAIDGSNIGIGMSVCVPWDKYNDEMGHGIARGKAEKNPKINITWEYPIDKHIIDSILLGIEKSMRKKPGKYIAGYKKKKRTNIAKDIVQNK